MNSYPYEKITSPEEVNMVSARLEKISRIFFQQQQKGLFPGGQIVIRRYNKPVMNLSCGVARGWKNRGGEIMDVTQKTPFAVFSTGKPMAAVIIALLESRGLINVDDPICKYLPELGTLGREKITVLDVLTHKSGIIIPDLIDNYKICGDSEVLWQKLIETSPRYTRGTFAYMPTEYGIILDRLVIAITRKNMAELFVEELANPLGLSNMHYGLGNKNLSDIAWNYWLGKEKCMVAEMNIADGFDAYSAEHEHPFW